MKCIRVRFAAVAIFCVIAAGTMPSASRSGLVAAWAQNLGQRDVSGSVVEGSSEPVAGSTVFLKNQKTKSIRSYTSTKDGRFHFAQVNMSDDYDLWAEKDSRKTAVKTVSSWDTRKEFEVELKLK